MKLSILFFVLLLASEAFAEGWVVVEFSLQEKYKLLCEVNSSSIENSGNNIKRAQYRLNFTNYPNGTSLDGKFSQLVTIADFNCAKSRYKMLESTGIRHGRILGTDRLTSVYEYADPTSLTGKALRYICDDVN